jgi:hypothetical protein
MSKRHPYVGRPNYQFWLKEPALEDMRRFDPVGIPSFRIDEGDRIVTAGSCFAQHVARFLAKAGFNFLVTEQPHPLLTPEIAAAMSYGLFSARYGNVYNARQLRQLLQRAYGEFTPIDSAWALPDGRWIDPFRPQILPGGYINPIEVAMDREVHFAAVRDAIEQMSVFVFTLGLTETWVNKRDGAVFPLAPGVAGGRYDEEIYSFHNLTLPEVVEDLQWSLDFIRARNQGVKFIITVSPVPLNATAVDQHVALSTAYSKAVLRVAAEHVTAANQLCDYYPSYEIITTSFTRSAYFGQDCREIEEHGVEHVMSLFLKHYGGLDNGKAGTVMNAPAPVAASITRQRIKQAEAMLKILCDEEAIDNN